MNLNWKKFHNFHFFSFSKFLISPFWACRSMDFTYNSPSSITRNTFSSRSHDRWWYIHDDIHHVSIGYCGFLNSWMAFKCIGKEVDTCCFVHPPIDCLHHYLLRQQGNSHLYFTLSQWFCYRCWYCNHTDFYSRNFGQKVSISTYSLIHTNKLVKCAIY